MNEPILPTPPAPPIPSVAPVLPPVEKSKSWLKILLAGIGVLIILGLFGGIYLLSRNQKPVAEITPTPTPIAATPTPDPTANWKTYTTAKFSFKYPSMWFVGISADGTILLDNKLIEATKVVEPNQVLITIETITNRNLINSYLANPPGGSEKRVINSVPFDYINVNYQGGQPSKQIIFAQAENGNSLYRLGLANISVKDTFDQILSTFKFLDQNQADATANWKIYTNTKYRFEIKYPSDFEIVKGPVPESELPTLGNISFSGKQKPQDSNSGVVFGLNANPTDADGVTLSCADNESCLNAWMKVLNRAPSQVSFVSANILGVNQKGFEYINQNQLYTQRNRYFVFPYNGKVWAISITINNYSEIETQEINSLFNLILSTFQFLPYI